MTLLLWLTLLNIGTAEESPQKPVWRQTVVLEAASASDDGSMTGPTRASVVSSAPAVLDLDQVVADVLGRNPSVEEMAATWEAAKSRYPQVTSLEDPMAGVTIGPGSIGSRNVDFGYRLEVSQKLPYPGKRRLRGEVAADEAAAAGQDVENLRLDLVQSTKAAFYDYFLVDRALAVNAEAVRLLGESRRNAESQYRTGVATQQDVLQADVELGRQRERELQLRRMRRVAVSRLNTLMHRAVDTPLPLPPESLAVGTQLLDVASLRESAAAQRPDVHALATRLAADEAAIALARKEFKPDVEVVAAYDAFWQPTERDLRPMVGVRINVPVQRSRRWAALHEAQARAASRRATLTSLTDRVRFEVEDAYAQVRESEQTVRLYNEQILRAAEESVKAAQSAYVTGKAPFLTFITAQRDLVSLRDRSYEAVADYSRRMAALDRAVGAPIAVGACPDTRLRMRPVGQSEGASSPAEARRR